VLGFVPAIARGFDRRWGIVSAIDEYPLNLDDLQSIIMIYRGKLLKGMASALTARDVSIYEAV
jgi:hypothetical protein